MATKKQTEIERLALNIVDNEKKAYEDAVCWVTDKVGFKMRDMIRLLRKNYWGVFDEPTDPTTGQDKVWSPLIMSFVEDIMKNIDVDTKDIGFRARKQSAIGLTEVVRAYVKEFLRKQNIGEVLDESERSMLIDGTFVWKTWTENGKPVRKTVDLLNFYISPDEDNIQSAYRVTERSIQTPDQIAGMNGWMNTEGIKGSTNLNKTDGDMANGVTNGTGNFVDVWEMWGKMPKYLITGKKADMNIEIDGRIVVSGLESGDKRVHLVEINDTKDPYGMVLKPYEECRVAKITGRWYGLGYGERLLALQEYMNIVLNTRITRSKIAQMGLFKIRKGAGITPQMLRKLPVNGALLLNNMDDIEQMPIQDVPQSSYNDENVIKEWAMKVTQAYSITAGDQLPASTSATQSAIQNTNAKSGFTLIKEQIGFFLTRWIERHLMPSLASTLNKEKIVRLIGDDDKYKEYVESIVNYYALQELAKYEGMMPPSEMEVMNILDSAREKLVKQQMLFVDVTKKVMADAFEVQTQITNEDLDVQTTVNNLMGLMGIPVTPDNEPRMRQVYDLLGLDFPKINAQAQIQGEMPNGGQPMQTPTQQDMQSITTQAVV